MKKNCEFSLRQQTLLTHLHFRFRNNKFEGAGSYYGTYNIRTQAPEPTPDWRVVTETGTGIGSLSVVGMTLWIRMTVTGNEIGIMIVDIMTAGTVARADGTEKRS